MHNLIKKYREDAGFRQGELAAVLGWKQSRWSNYERGERTPGITDARDIVRAFSALGVEVSLDQLFPEKTEAA